MSMLNAKTPKFGKSMTKQSFKDETDINKILQRAQKTGTISHLNKYEAQYGDFSDYDFFNNSLMMAKGREIFDELPSEVRNEFKNSPAGFFKYVNSPENKDKLAKLLPALAEPGRQNISTSGIVPADAPSEPVASIPAEAPPTPENPPAAGTGTP